MLQCCLLFVLGEFWGWNQWTLEASNQSMKRSNLFIKLPVPTYLWLSMHISQPIFQSQDGKVTSFDSKPHSCSLSNFLLWCLVFQQQQLILAAMERSTKSIKKQLSSNVLHGDAMRQATKHRNEGSWLRGFYLPGQFDSMLPNKSDAIIPSELYLLYCIMYSGGYEWPGLFLVCSRSLFLINRVWCQIARNFFNFWLRVLWTPCRYSQWQSIEGNNGRSIKIISTTSRSMIEWCQTVSFSSVNSI